MIFDNIQEWSKNSQGRSLKARGLIFWILALNIRIKAPVKIENREIVLKILRESHRYLKGVISDHQDKNCQNPSSTTTQLNLTYS